MPTIERQTRKYAIAWLKHAIPFARDELTRAQRARETAEELCAERLEELLKLRREAVKYKLDI